LVISKLSFYALSIWLHEDPRAMSFEFAHLPEIDGTISIHEAAKLRTLPMLEDTLIHCA
jgi:hypothetical protein